MIKYLQQQFAFNTTADVKYFPALNGVKGMIILMIVITHCLPDSMVLFFMYLFHMPIFLAMSGFLLKQKAFDKGGWNFAKKIGNRLVIPWLVASLLYLPFQPQQSVVSNIGVGGFLYPFYHLWYIPAYILGSAVCYLMSRAKIPAWPLILVSAAITIIWYLVFRDNQLPVNAQPFYWMGEKRFYAYLFFFVLGYSLRNQLLTIRPPFIALVFVMISSLILMVLCVYLKQPDWLSVAPYMFFNFSLVIIVLQYIAPMSIFQHKLFKLLNKQSLGVYLYHPMIIMIIYQLLNDPHKLHVSKWQGGVIGVVTIAIVLLLIDLLQRIPFTNRFILGIVKKVDK